MLYRKFNSLLIALALSGSSVMASAETYHVEIDTSTFGTQGWIDLSFLRSSSLAASATATLSDFVGFDTTTAAQPWGNVSGSLAQGYALSSADIGADLFHAVNFGGKVGFNIAFDGDTDPGLNRALSSLSISLYGADGATLLGNGEAVNGALAQLYWTPSKSSVMPGTVSYQVFDGVVSIAPAAAVPEPSTWAMLGLGLGLMGLLGQRRKLSEQFAAA